MKEFIKTISAYVIPVVSIIIMIIITMLLYNVNKILGVIIGVLFVIFLWIYYSIKEIMRIDQELFEENE